MKYTDQNPAQAALFTLLSILYTHKTSPGNWCRQLKSCELCADRTPDHAPHCAPRILSDSCSNVSNYSYAQVNIQQDSDHCLAILYNQILMTD